MAGSVGWLDGAEMLAGLEAACRSDGGGPGHRPGNQSLLDPEIQWGDFADPWYGTLADQRRGLDQHRDQRIGQLASDPPEGHRQDLCRKGRNHRLFSLTPACRILTT
jgi:hypothetical protein